MNKDNISSSGIYSKNTSLVQYLKINTCNLPSQTKKKQTIILIDAKILKKIFNIQHPFIKKLPVNYK